MSVLNKVTFYNKTISLSKEEMLDLLDGKYTTIMVSYIGKVTGRNKTPTVFKTEVTWIQDVINSAKEKDDYYIATFR